MKIKVNTRARIVAVYWPKMGAWDFYKILATGKPSEHQPTIIAFTPVFSEAVTTVRNDHKEIPASGWEGRKDDVDPALDRMTWIAHQFKAAIS